MLIRKTDDSGAAINWQKMCWLRFGKFKLFVMECKETFKDEWKTVNFNKKNSSTKPTSHYFKTFIENTNTDIRGKVSTLE